MTPKHLLAAAALCACCGLPATSQQAESPTGAPVIVQPGAPGHASTPLNSVTAVAAVRPPSEADVKFMQDMIMHHGQAVEMTELAKSRAKDPEVKEIASKIDVSQSDEMRWMKQWLTDRGIPVETMSGMDTMGVNKGMKDAGGTGGAHAGMATMDHGNMAGMGHGNTDHSDMAGMDHSKMPNMHPDSADRPNSSKKVDPQDVAMMPGMLTPRQMQTLRASTGTQFDELFLTGMMQHHGGALLMVKDLFSNPGAGQDPYLFDFANDVDNTQLAEIDIMKGILRKVKP